MSKPIYDPFVNEYILLKFGGVIAIEGLKTTRPDKNQEFVDLNIIAKQKSVQMDKDGLYYIELQANLEQVKQMENAIVTIRKAMEEHFARRNGSPCPHGNTVCTSYCQRPLIATKIT